MFHGSRSTASPISILELCRTRVSAPQSKEEISGLIAEVLNQLPGLNSVNNASISSAWTSVIMSSLGSSILVCPKICFAWSIRSSSFFVLSLVSEMLGTGDGCFRWSSYLSPSTVGDRRGPVRKRSPPFDPTTLWSLSAA